MEWELNDTTNQTELLEWVEREFDFRFYDPALAVAALTHKSFANESNSDIPYNERLEFLGDAVLSLVICAQLFEHPADLNEGGMTRARADIVSEASLATVARKIGLGSHLRLGRGEDLTGGRDKESLLADALEALFGAIFQDAGYDEAARVVCLLLSEEMSVAAQRKRDLDSKTELQELLQAQHGQLPQYVLRDVEGPDHDRNYHVEVRFAGEMIGKGMGRSKKKAEQAAAACALKRLGVC